MRSDAAEGIVDVHAHFVPEGYRREAVAAGHGVPDGMPAWPAWDIDSQLRFMDGMGIERSVLSISSPGVHFGDDAAAARLAREVNDEAAALHSLHPDRIGFFASLPLPDVEAALSEAERALDELGAEGVVMLSNVGGHYLGDPALEPLYAMLAGRGATVFLHPTSPVCGAQLSLGRPAPIIEFPLDTTRTVIDLVLSGMLIRNRGMRLIVPHGGGALAALADRVEEMSRVVLRSEDGVLTALQEFYYDTAGSLFPRQASALLALVGADRLLYGSDWPFTPVHASQALLDDLQHTPLLDDRDRDRILRLTARTLLSARPQP